MTEDDQSAGMKNDRVDSIVCGVRMIGRKREEHPEFLGGLGDSVLNAIGELIRFYMHVAKQVAYIKKMESSYREWQQARSTSLELRAEPQTTGGAQEDFEGETTQNFGIEERVEEDEEPTTQNYDVRKIGKDPILP